MKIRRLTAEELSYAVSPIMDQIDCPWAVYCTGFYTDVTSILLELDMNTYQMRPRPHENIELDTYFTSNPVEYFSNRFRDMNIGTINTVPLQDYLCAQIEFSGYSSAMNIIEFLVGDKYEINLLELTRRYSIHGNIHAECYFGNRGNEGELIRSYKVSITNGIMHQISYDRIAYLEEGMEYLPMFDRWKSNNREPIMYNRMYHLI